jgi:predicted acyl esterase
MRSPYVDAEQDLSGEEICARLTESHRVYLEHGYAVVFQHCRGRGRSTGDCIPYIFEREDGLAFQAWVREQPF